MKILICDDHQLYRDGVCLALRQLAANSQVSEAASGEEALALMKKQAFDVVLMDINLPGKSGLQLLLEIKLKWPETQVLMLSQYEEKNYALRSIKMGASGYLNKDVAPGELIKAIGIAMKGEIYRSARLRELLNNDKNIDKIKHRHDVLSKREFPILCMFGKGKTQKEIAEMLYISEKTVSVHKSHIMQKMQFANDFELAKYCYDSEII